MTAQTQKPSPFPVRKVGDNHWEVLIVPKNTWLPCAGEADACAIAKAPLLKHQCLAEERSDPDFADQLEKTAEVLARHDIGFEAHFLRLRAEEIRRTARSES
ncbi:MAG: hypothetical protein IID34_08705 [Planctomycetes bacterium]|nr:hypothetical protein [Planctomycetota bacterium]